MLPSFVRALFRSLTRGRFRTFPQGRFRNFLRGKSRTLVTYNDQLSSSLFGDAVHELGRVVHFELFRDPISSLFPGPISNLWTRPNRQTFKFSFSEAAVHERLLLRFSVGVLIPSFFRIRFRTILRGRVRTFGHDLTTILSNFFFVFERLCYGFRKGGSLRAFSVSDFELFAGVDFAPFGTT